jgi:hypothetical protein
LFDASASIRLESTKILLLTTNPVLLPQPVLLLGILWLRERDRDALTGDTLASVKAPTGLGGATKHDSKQI